MGRTPARSHAETFDLVLAADVLYEERNALPLLDLLDRCVAADGEALIADPGRRHARAFFDARPRGRVVDRAAAVGELLAGGIARLHPPAGQDAGSKGR